MPPRSVHTVSTVAAATSAPIRRPMSAVSRARRGSPAPMAWAVSVAVATESESGSMKQSAARLATTWWPPITVVPRRAASSVMAVNDVASSA